MGTLVRITVYAPDAGTAQAGFTAAFARIAALDATFSDYRHDSELSRLTPGPPVPVSADLYHLLHTAQAVSRATRGAFDITAGALTRLWRQGRVPAAADLARARQATGYRSLRVGKGTTQLTRPGMRLDAGGIAKGFAAQQALRVLAAMELPRALVAVSGDIAVGDSPPGTSGWRIEAQGQVLTLRNCAVSTSGSSEQFFEAAGRRYSHIIDPRTGMPLNHQRSVTVIHREGAWADALATAYTVSGEKSGIVDLTRGK